MNVSKKLHILFISSWFPTRINPYSGDFVQRHAKAVSRLHKVTAIHAEGSDQIKKSETLVNPISNNYKEIICYFPKSKWKLLNFFKKMRTYNTIAKQFEEYDLIHANVIYYNLLWATFQKIFKKKPMVITEHSTVFHHKLGWYKKLIFRFIGSNANLIMPVSDDLKNAMLKNGINGNYKSNTIPNVVNTLHFQPKKTSSNTKKIFLHISMLLDCHKNISGQLKAAKILNDKGYRFEFHIGGNGNNQKILDFIQKNKASHYIKTFGALSHKEVAEKMKKADAFVLFSHKENQPCVIIESFSVGTPVIASDVGGVSEFFPKDFGKLIPVNDLDALVSAMEDIIQGKTYASPLVMHDYVEATFSEKVIAEKYNEVYQHLI